MLFISRLAVTVLAISLVLPASESTSCTRPCLLARKRAQHTISGNCKVDLGDQMYCESCGHYCDSFTLHEMSVGIPQLVKGAKHCVIERYNIVSGTKTVNDIRMNPACLDYNDGPISYKFVSATSCVCELQQLYYVPHWYRSHFPNFIFKFFYCITIHLFCPSFF